MSTEHESHFNYAEDQAKRATRRYQINFVTNAVGFGLTGGIAIGLILEIGMGIVGAGGTFTILGSVIGGLIGVLLLYIDAKREAKSSVTPLSNDIEPPEPS